MTSGVNTVVETDENLLRTIELYLAVRSKSAFTFLNSETAKNLLANNTVIETYLAGEEIFRPKHKPAHLYIVAKGTVAAISRRRGIVKASEFSEGKSLEMATLFLEQSEWDSDWKAVTNSTLLRVEWDAFKLALDSKPGLRRYLELISTRYELQKFKNDAKFLGLSQQDTIKLFSAFREIRLENINEETIKDSLFIVASGDVRLYGNLDGVPLTLGYFAPGDQFYCNSTVQYALMAEHEKLVCWHLNGETGRKLIGNEKFEGLTKFLDVAETKARQLQSAKVSDVAGRNELIAPSAIDDDDHDDLDVKDFVLEVGKKFRKRRRNYFVKQHDEMDCGAACLSMVANTYGKHIGIPTLRSKVHITRNGASLFSLKKGANSIGMQAIGIHSSSEGLRQLNLPLIALMQYHFVVVYKITQNHVVVGDPARGIHNLTREQFRDEFSSNALLLKPTEDFFQFPESKSTYFKYIKFVFTDYRDWLRLAFLTFCIFFMGLALPVVSQLATDNVAVGGKYSDLVVLVLCMGVAGILSTTSSLVRGYLMSHYAGGMDIKLSALMQQQIFKLPISFFAVRRLGDITSRLAELGKVRSFIAGKPMSISLNIISVLLYGAVIFLYSQSVFLALLPAVLIMCAFVLWISPRMIQLNISTFKAESTRASSMIEHFAGIDTIQSIQGATAARWRWEQKLVQSRALQIKSSRISAYTGVFSQLMQSATSLLLLYLAVGEYSAGNLTLGQVLAISTLAGQVLEPAVSLVQEWQGFTEIRQSLDRVDDIFTAAVEEPDTKKLTALQKEQVIGKIEFRNVEFRYGSENSPQVLKGVSLTIEPGQTVAFVGRSGSGKSTLGYLVNRLYSPTAGRILLDDVEVSNLSINSLRKCVAMVLQEGAVFSGTVQENIALGDQNYSYDKVLAAAKAADAHDFICQLPFGYNTMLGENGRGLSGGQRQRIAIARAIYREPSILVLDEATSALDAVSERIVMDQMRKGKSSTKRTTIVIAHRLNTVVDADKIFVLDQGQIIEAGTHKELFARQGFYFELFRRQLSS